jgi:UDP-N-acetylmuramoyl-tripeptide--D-alanyl-D-alanine ligase
MFFAIKGEHFNGNHYAAQALNNGAKYAIVDDPGIAENEQFILVDNTLQTLQDLASLHRDKMNAKVIAITGSNGKTTTKELISAVMASAFKITVTHGNLNNHIGVPLTILSIRDDDEFAVIEMGANHLGEIASLCQIAKPDSGLITNIGKAHLEGFGGFQGVVKAKSELYQYLQENNKMVFVNMDDDLLVSLTDKLNTYGYGTTQRADCRGEILSSDPYIDIHWSTNSKEGLVKTNLYGSYNFDNIMAAISIGTYFGIAPEKIDLSIAAYIPDNNRSQIIKTGANTLILDAYNANPSSMKKALEDFNIKKDSGKMIILGDMAELGEYSHQEHVNIIDRVREMKIDQVILVGKAFCQAAGSGPWQRFENTEDAGRWLKNNPVKNMSILLKGSRIMKLENLREWL